MARVARGSTVNLIGAAVTGVATFAMTVAVTRGLSTASAGVFFSATSLFILVTSVGQLGTQTGVVYFIARSRAVKAPELARSYVSMALRPVLVVALVVAVTTFVAAPDLARVLVPDHAAEATTYLRVLAVFIPVVSFESIMLAGTRGLGSMRPSAVVEQIARPLLQLTLVGAAVTVASTATVGLAWAVAYVPAAVVSWLWWRRLRPAAPIERPEHLSGPFWRFTGPRALTSVIQAVMQRFDIVLVGAMAGAVEAAVYAAATRFIVAGQLGTNALSLAAQPSLAATLATDDRAGANQLYRVTTAWLMLVTWPLYLLFVLFPEPLLQIFGRDYKGGEDVLLLISLSMLLSTGLGMVDTILSMAGHTTWNLANATLALAVNLGLDLWLIPSHGVLGAAIGWASAIAVRNIVAFVQVAASLKLQPVDSHTAAAGGLTVLAYVGVLGLTRILLGTSWTAMLTGMLAATVVYIIGLWVLRKPLELDALRSLRRRSR